MKNKTVFAFSFLIATSFSATSFAKSRVICEKKREQIEKSVCGKSTSDEKRKECIAFYKNAACDTVALHESFDQ